MKHWGDPPFEARLPPETVLNQMEMAVIVCDRFSNIIYSNAFAKKLFGFGGSEFIGQSVLSLGIAEDDHEQADREVPPEEQHVEEAEHPQPVGNRLDAPRRRPLLRRSSLRRYEPDQVQRV